MHGRLHKLHTELYRVEWDLRVHAQSEKEVSFFRFLALHGIKCVFITAPTLYDGIKAYCYLALSCICGHKSETKMLNLSALWPIFRDLTRHT